MFHTGTFQILKVAFFDFFEYNNHFCPNFTCSPRGVMDKAWDCYSEGLGFESYLWHTKINYFYWKLAFFSKFSKSKMYYLKCTMMKQILALLSWGLICIPKEPKAFTFAKMEVGHPVLWHLGANLPWKTVKAILNAIGQDQ